MSEEVKDAGVTVPRAIVWSYISNGLMGILLLITYLSCIPSVDDAVNDPSGYPFLYVFQQSMSTGAVNALTTLLLVLVVASNIGFNTSTSRQTFAFARDNGLPFSKWISHVRLRHFLVIQADPVILLAKLTSLPRSIPHYKFPPMLLSLRASSRYSLLSSTLAPPPPSMQLFLSKLSL